MDQKATVSNLQSNSSYRSSSPPGRKTGPYWEAKTQEERTLSQMIEATLLHHGLTGWRVIFTRESVRLGYCSYTTKEIAISRKLMGSWPDAVDTAMHEAAHAIVGPLHHHGPAWKAMAKKLGATPEAQSDYTDESLLGSTRSVSTIYGDYRVSFGGDSYRLMDKDLIAVGYSRGFLLMRDSAGKNYKIEPEFFHPHYGDHSKILEPKSKIFGGPRTRVKVTTGVSYYDFQGVRYYASKILRSNVLCISKDGARLKVPGIQFF